MAAAVDELCYRILLLICFLRLWIFSLGSPSALAGYSLLSWHLFFFFFWPAQ